MKKLFFITLVFLCMGAVYELDPRIESSECKYKKVAASTTDTAGGFTGANGTTYGVHSFKAHGADPSAYVALVWDYNGAGEKIFASTKGDISEQYDVSLSQYQFTGTGTAKLSIVIYNDNTAETPVIGGCVEVIKL